MQACFHGDDSTFTVNSTFLHAGVLQAMLQTFEHPELLARAMTQVIKDAASQQGHLQAQTSNSGQKRKREELHSEEAEKQLILPQEGACLISLAQFLDCLIVREDEKVGRNQCVHLLLGVNLAVRCKQEEESACALPTQQNLQFLRPVKNETFSDGSKQPYSATSIEQEILPLVKSQIETLKGHLSAVYPDAHFFAI